MHLDPNWVAAIGQVLGAVATFLAVIAAPDEASLGVVWPRRLAPTRPPRGQQDHELIEPGKHQLASERAAVPTPSSDTRTQTSSPYGRYDLASRPSRR